MTTTKSSETRLYSFNDNRFRLNSIKNNPHDDNLYLFKRDLINKMYTAPIELLYKTRTWVREKY